jgi:hypothetical protein
MACEAVQFTGLRCQQPPNESVDDRGQAVGWTFRGSLRPRRAVRELENGRADYEAVWRSDDTPDEQATAAELTCNLQRVTPWNIGSIGKAGATPRTHDRPWIRRSRSSVVSQFRHEKVD